MRKKTLPAILLGLAVAITGATTASDTQSLRQWRDNTGTFSVEARLVPEDTNGQQVTIALKSGRHVTLPMRRLSEEDREFVASQAESTSQTLPQPVTRKGIQWQDSLDDAAAVAAAGATSDDDRPIMCFRALGDLSGFM